jgi:hypothetical protein
LQHPIYNSYTLHTKTKLKIGCPIHGFFEQQPGAHLNGNGCARCAGTARKSTEEFIIQAREVHGDQYDYSRTEYIRALDNVTIICPEHGEFQQIAVSHLRGRGCPTCAVPGFKPQLPGTLYYLRIERFNQAPLYKIGITNRTVHERFPHNEDRSKIVVLGEWHYQDGGKAYEREREIMQAHRDEKYSGPPVLDSGNTELFNSDVLQLDLPQ